ncbi:Crp/Fnr family transcriptional regulator [Aquimarina macrocephali]|uniref:Crp/Fnr family transcriptional regulator n=1 Tax=Aquimarina macrocephali TaxID=666563 RepID=UPI000467735F|nr:Crp/Fnr family transcriptional regulator [Aquimarina macrocephali]
MNQSHFLKSIFKSENFNSKELELILMQFEEVEFNKNEYLIEKGKVANYYFFLETGFLRSFTIDIEGNDVTTKFFSKNDIVIDWHSYFLKKPCKESIQALTKGNCWKISFNNFMKLFSIEAFREVGRTRLINNYFELKNHSISIIADQAKDRYLHLLKEKPSIIQNIPLKYIATYLGVTDTSLSRIRKEITL